MNNKMVTSYSVMFALLKQWHPEYVVCTEGGGGAGGSMRVCKGQTLAEKCWRTSQADRVRADVLSILSIVIVSGTD